MIEHFRLYEIETIITGSTNESPLQNFALIFYEISRNKQMDAWTSLYLAKLLKTHQLKQINVTSLTAP